jgi:hypothetical protein
VSNRHAPGERSTISLHLQRIRWGGIRCTLYCTISYKTTDDDNVQAFIHALLVPPQRAISGLSQRIEPWEEGTAEEKRKLKEKYTTYYVNALSVKAMKDELDSLGIKAAAQTRASLRDTLLRVGRTGSRVHY